ncbi:hypothetical protein BJX70DRAFT_399929 [Aspergillus crustosus]
MSFTLINGQLYTPGLAIINAPQPYTPLGGDTLHISIDVSGNGALSVTPGEDDDDNYDAPTLFHDLRIFLTNEENGRNLTISNGTIPDSGSKSGSDSGSDSDPESEYGSYVGPILDLEPSSTVKHVNWLWPDCFVGSGSGSASESESSNNDEDNWRGDWNISLHQSFRWDDEEYYTVFNLPISVVNGVEGDEGRVGCGRLVNEYESGAVDRSNASLDGGPWVGGRNNGTVIDGDGDGDGENTGVSWRGGSGLRGLGLGWVICWVSNWSSL